VQDLYTFCAHFTLHVSVNSLHPAQWLLTEHMISIATTLEANECEDAENPNTDKYYPCYWQNYSRYLQNTSGVPEYTVNSM